MKLLDDWACLARIASGGPSRSGRPGSPLRAARGTIVTSVEPEHEPRFHGELGPWRVLAFVGVEAPFTEQDRTIKAGDRAGQDRTP